MSLTHAVGSGIVQLMSDSPYYKEGYEAGKNAASWVFDGNTDLATYARVLRGFEDGDPEIMDMQPAPLSGEFAGGSMNEILGIFDNDEDQNEAADAYEEGFSEGYWAEIQDTCHYHLGTEDNEDG